MADWLIGLSGVMVGALIGWIGSIYTLKKQEYYRASKVFRDAFTDTIHYLKTFKKPNNLTRPIGFHFEQNMEKYEKAIIDFLPYLKKTNKVALEEALENLKYAFEFDDLYGDSENIIKEKDYKHSSFMFYDGYRNNSPKGITIPWKKGLEIAQKNINLIVEFGKVR
ncbi:MAG: hypothetical protein KAS53_00690 [Candidatus Cloacimonetes bacterium]|nr:hypothetical protein [Candidatus Cloacimonadota bacterium]